MKLVVIGSGSLGNCYLLIAENGDVLILDAGVQYKKLIASLAPYGGLRNVRGCLVTHEHQDHALCVPMLLQRGISCYMSAPTKSSLDDNIALTGPSRLVKGGETFSVLVCFTECFTVKAFETEHDAAGPLGYLIRCNSTGEIIVYATDTYFLRNTFVGVNYWLVECSYNDDIVREQLDSGSLNKPLYDRLASSHMSLNRLKSALAANDLTWTRKIVLIHMSDTRSDEARMVREIATQTGKETVAASNGMVIDLALAPF